MTKKKNGLRKDLQFCPVYVGLDSRLRGNDKYFFIHATKHPRAGWNPVEFFTAVQKK
jgi:hypothetical protein